MTSKEEHEHFAREEYEKRKTLARKLRGAMQEEERAKLKELHWMHCPKCGSELVTLSLHAVEVDKCPSCSGLWLDVGELDQILERDDRGALRKLIDIFK